MKYLITGGAGFIGSHLTESLLSNSDNEVVIIDNLVTGKIENLEQFLDNTRFTFVNDTILNFEVLYQLIEDCDFVFHFASSVGVKYILANQLKSIDTIIIGTRNVFEICTKLNKRVIFSSSSEVYGKNTKKEYFENDDKVIGPTSVFRWSYSVGKTVAEYYATAFKEKGLQYEIVRFFNIIGPKQLNKYGMVVPTFVSQALNGNELTIYGTGTQVRCFTSVYDVVELCYRLSKLKEATCDIYNIGSCEITSINELADLVIKLTNSTSKKKYMVYEEAYGSGYEDCNRRVSNSEKLLNVVGPFKYTKLECIVNKIIYYEKTRSIYSRLDTKLVSINDIDEVLQNENILGIIEYTSNISTLQSKIHPKIPFMTVNMESYSSDKSFLEIWTSNLDITYGYKNNFKYAFDDENLFMITTEKENNVNLDILGEKIYDNLFDIIKMLNYKNLCRMWNYFPKITELDSSNVERYKSFCFGRSTSFYKNYTDLKTENFPAATETGCNYGDINICFISSSKPVTINIENPRQVPAYKYPKKYGIKSPSFSRATYCLRKDNRYTIYVSGTASILNHKTVFENDVTKQCITALENIQVLISKENLQNHNIDADVTIRDLDSIKVYIRNAKDFPTIQKICSDYFSQSANIIYLRADICRNDLLLEIEGIISK